MVISFSKNVPLSHGRKATKLVFAARVGILILWMLGLAAAAEPVLVGKSKDAIKGSVPGPARDDIVPGRFMVDPPTLENLGFRWYVSGDYNRNASVSVESRKIGDKNWSRGMNLLRVFHEIANQDYGPYRTGNLFAGSVLFLQPGTPYEIRFTMVDPDGGSPAEPKIIEVSTRSEPQASEGGKTIHASPKSGLAAAYKQAGPGDVILLHAGVYRGPFALSKSGEPGRPIVFRGAGDGVATLEAPGEGRTRIISLGGTDHLMFEDLVFRNAHTAISSGKPGSQGITVRRCRIEGVINGISTQSENSRDWLIADNEIIGINKTWYPRPEKSYMSPAETGVNLYGQGHVVCYNRITRFSDALAIANFGPPVEDLERHCVAIDFYGNDLSFAQDDTLETDYGCHNVRVYRNRCYNTHTALSVQPSYGGPIYLIRNEAYGITSLNLKLNNYPAGVLAYNNTLCCAQKGFTPPSIWQNGHFRNNLFMGGRGYAMETGTVTAYSTLDYNGYRRNSKEQFLKWRDPQRKTGRYQTLAAFYKATGYEEHGLEVDYDIFRKAGRPEEGKTYDPQNYDLQVKPKAKCVDAGVVIMQVTENFTGSAPDLGCYEQGQSPPHYGPRLKRGRLKTGP